MDQLWTPWRYSYVTKADGEPRPGVAGALAAWPGDSGCVFCNLIASVDHAIQTGMSPNEAEAAAGLVLRARHCYVCLNAYPYTSGHVMVVPYAHTADFPGLGRDTASEMMMLSQQVQSAIDDTYHPDGFNLGMNLGRSAGAGIADHLHMHVLPRWTGDTNFMTTVSETRLEPEDLSVTYTKLRKALAL